MSAHRRVRLKGVSRPYGGSMFVLQELDLPVVAAPMAGGPSTPELVAAVSDAGGFAFLAAGYLAPDAVAQQLAATRAVTSRPFGVNVFVPEGGAVASAAEVARFRERLLPLAQALGVESLPEPHPDDDGWDAKLALLERDPVAVVSFTFGLPTPDAVARLHAVGTSVWASVASVPDAVAAARLGVDALVVQGAEAGGHRATLRCADVPNELGTTDLVRAVHAVTRLPLVAAGGIMDAAGARHSLDAGATAVQCGTAFLLTPEAGTAATHRAALADPSFAETVVTRAFTGRPARALTNAWTRQFADAPAAYPQVHQLTRPLRAASGARGDADGVHLWAGSGWASASREPAAVVAAGLAPGHSIRARAIP